MTSLLTQIRNLYIFSENIQPASKRISYLSFVTLVLFHVVIRRERSTAQPQQVDGESQTSLITERDKYVAGTGKSLGFTGKQSVPTEGSRKWQHFSRLDIVKKWKAASRCMMIRDIFSWVASVTIRNGWFPMSRNLHVRVDARKF